MLRPPNALQIPALWHPAGDTLGKQAGCWVVLVLWEFLHWGFCLEVADVGKLNSLEGVQGRVKDFYEGNSDAKGPWWKLRVR